MLYSSGSRWSVFTDYNKIASVLNRLDKTNLIWLVYIYTKYIWYLITSKRGEWSTYWQSYMGCRDDIQTCSISFKKSTTTTPAYGVLWYTSYHIHAFQVVMHLEMIDWTEVPLMPLDIGERLVTHRCLIMPSQLTQFTNRHRCVTSSHRRVVSMEVTFSLSRSSL